MDLYIKIENGIPVGNPILLSNLQETYSNFLDRYSELGYLPCQYLTPPSSSDPYTAVVPVYTINETSDGVITTYTARAMTSEERLQKIENAKLNPKPYESWVFNNDVCNWVAPIEYPNDGGEYIWDEETTSWILIGLEE